MKPALPSGSVEPTAAVLPSDTASLEASTIRRVTVRILPFLVACYFFAFISRTNAGLAALQMNRDIGLSAAAFGWGGSLFFVSYTLFGIPCNLAMVRVGARLWLTLIILALSAASLAMTFVAGPRSFYLARFLLGITEAGFFPGAVLYLTCWFPRAYRARIIAAFMVATPFSSFLGSPLSAALLGLEGRAGLHGWQWMFLLEALPLVVFGVLAFSLLPNQPSSARWLAPEQARWLSDRLASERLSSPSAKRPSLSSVLFNGPVLLLSLAYAASSAASNSLSLWQPQIIQSFGLGNWETGLLNALPFGLGVVAMIAWGRRSDRLGERRRSVALPLALCAVSLALTLATHSLAVTMVLLCAAIVGTYAVKGPFWALAGEWLPTDATPTGIAAINTWAHIATFGAISLIGLIKSSTGSFSLALLPLALLGVAGAFGVLRLGGKPSRVES
ncbi:MAG: phthalate transporter [Verrucomicrobia bacterium]|nr:phthalate transporter [Verrucomicrobiota bacterium]